MQLPVNPGNSGGPVFDPDTGEVYGIVSRRFEPKGIPAGLCVVEPVVRVMEAIADW
jgi:S1-C subfamily serine protease